MNPIRRIRRAVLDVTQAELAEAAGVTQACVSKWERNRSSPSLVQLERICEKYPAVQVGDFAVKANDNKSQARQAP
jgi:predicted transcriptional regulator